ncbi:TetR/AcrR family transcriptional regulator [Pseudovibrio sp. Tun.PSC04-5.I4]|uniref:TetR/AcrR family transcriptional regulator n=1 Tax=Pseudovibrio sp. Tun.PSC04-5.I4 TaxID=1798213 RepID=UPI00088D0E01|nr:TetR/AcrR family transcriptional regulator [Pseudovibrio sp. Tun.PSC04-5.I4]SDR48096.1 DNA-binding transcriptional regulator, AcrR family [Pseudovibrio sp. Tun.PSC04-5.I4]
MTKNRQTKLAQREQAILNAARKIVVDGGLLAFRMPDLTKSAEVSVGTLYRHFQSREDVIASLATNSLIVRHTKLVMVMDQFQGALERALVIPMLDFIFNVAHPEAFLIETTCTTSTIWKEVSILQRQQYDAICEKITILMQQVAAGIEGFASDTHYASNADITLGIWGLITGMSFVWFSILDNEFKTPREALNFFRPHLVNFLRGYGPQLDIPSDTIAQLEHHLLDNTEQWLWVLEGNQTDETH